MQNKYIFAILCSVGLLCFASYSWATGVPINDFDIGSSQSDKDKSQPVSKPESEKAESEKTDSQKPNNGLLLPPVVPEPIRSGMLVVLIGINDYTESAIPDLSGTNDVRLALTDWLVPYSKTKNRVTVWAASDKIDDLAQEHSNLVKKCMLPTKANIVQLLKDTEKIDYNRLIVYFCGHGARIQNKSYLIPQDGTVDNVSSFISLKDEVFVHLDKSIVENKLLVLDSNFSTGTISDKRVTRVRASSNEDDFMSEFEPMLKGSKKTFSVITSCSKGEQAQEFLHGDTCHSLFSWYFIKGLVGEADMVSNYDGRVKLVEAYNYARSETYKHSVNSEYLDVQTPGFLCNDAYPFTISSAGNWVNETENETPWHLLYRTATNLAKQNDPVQQNPYGSYLSSNISVPSNKATRILSGMLEINPSDFSCYSIRSRIYRKKGMYKEALFDISKTGGTLDVYSKLNQTKFDEKTHQHVPSCTLYSSPRGKITAEQIDKVLPISLDAYYDGYYRIATIDGVKAQNEYWISERSISWDPKTAETVILGTGGRTIEGLQRIQERFGISIPDHDGPLPDPIGPM